MDSDTAMTTGGGFVAIFLVVIAAALAIMAVRGTYLLTWQAIRNLPNIDRSSSASTGELHGPTER